MSTTPASSKMAPRRWTVRSEELDDLFSDLLLYFRFGSFLGKFFRLFPRGRNPCGLWPASLGPLCFRADRSCIKILKISKGGT